MRQRKPLRLVILDYDGICVDTETPYWQRWTAEACRMGVDVLPQLWASITRVNANPASVFRKELGIDISAARTAQINTSVIDCIRAQGLMPGVQDRIDAWRSAGLIVALATNGDQAWLDLTMPRGFDTHFSTIEMSAGKPDPRALHRILQKHNVAPEEAIGAEDTPWGVQAFAAAGITAFFVPSAPYQSFHLPAVPRRASLDGLSVDALSLARPLPSSALEQAIV